MEHIQKQSKIAKLLMVILCAAFYVVIGAIVGLAIGLFVINFGGDVLVYLLLAITILMALMGEM